MDEIFGEIGIAYADGSIYTDADVHSGSNSPCRVFVKLEDGREVSVEVDVDGTIECRWGISGWTWKPGDEEPGVIDD